jgi:hypothetical protein
VGRSYRVFLDKSEEVDKLSFFCSLHSVGVIIRF